jgi:hypothetical protein
MALQLIYPMFSKFLDRVLLNGRSETTKEIEILVLRHQLAVLRQRTPRPRMSWADGAVIAAFTGCSASARRLGLVVTHRPPSCTGTGSWSSAAGQAHLPDRSSGLAGRYPRSCWHGPYRPGGGLTGDKACGRSGPR